MAEDPPLYAGRTAAFGRIMKGFGVHPNDGLIRVSQVEPVAQDLMAVTDEELLLLLQVAASDLKAYNVLARTIDHGIEVEVARRTIAAVNRNEEALRLNRVAVEQSTAALVAFKQESAKASDRLASLTTWLIVFTSALVLLSVALLVLAFKR